MLPYTSPFTVDTEGENELSRSGRRTWPATWKRHRAPSCGWTSPTRRREATRTETWRKDAVTVWLTAADPLSGVAATRFVLDGTEVATYTAPVTVTGDGMHTLEFWSTDVAGNTEATRSATVRVDAIALVYEQCEATASYVGNATIARRAIDDRAGVAASAARTSGTRTCPPCPCWPPTPSPASR